MHVHKYPVVGLSLAVLAAVGACEKDRVEVISSPLAPQLTSEQEAEVVYLSRAADTHSPWLVSSEITPMAKQDHARRLFEAKDYKGCAIAFAAAARESEGNAAAICWYHASRCAARSGDYQTSRFYISAAASAGYSNLGQLRTDPLLAPLRSSSRWQLIEDSVDANGQRMTSEREVSLAK